MEESTTYQEIMEKGGLKGEIKGARAMLVRVGVGVLGTPTAKIRASLDKIDDMSRLEQLMDRLRIGGVKSWAELLR